MAHYTSPLFLGTFFSCCQWRYHLNFTSPPPLLYKKRGLKKTEKCGRLKWEAFNHSNHAAKRTEETSLSKVQKRWYIRPSCMATSSTGKCFLSPSRTLCSCLRIGNTEIPVETRETFFYSRFALNVCIFFRTEPFFACVTTLCDYQSHQSLEYSFPMVKKKNISRQPWQLLHFKP